MELLDNYAQIVNTHHHSNGHRNSNHSSISCHNNQVGNGIHHPLATSNGHNVHGHSGNGTMTGSGNSLGQGGTTATPVISLFKLRNFLYQPKLKPPFGPSSSASNGAGPAISSSLPPSVATSQPTSSSSSAPSSSNQSNTNNHNNSILDGPPQGHHEDMIYGNSLHQSSRQQSNSLANNTSSNNLTQSMSIVMPQAMKSNGSTGRKYQCKMCPQVFGSKADMQLHTQVHMREAKPYKCSQCSKAFANSSYLSQHTRIHLGIKPYRCEICSRKFTQLSHLQQHIRTHTGDKPYKCRHLGCTKAFSQLSNLQSHSRCHQTDKPFKCNSCYKCFTDENSLLDHIPKHKESKHLKTHICEFCGKSYTQETYLAKHMAKHADRMAGEGKNRRSAQQQNSSAPNGSQIPDPYNWKHSAAPPSASDHMSNSADPNCAIALTSSESGRYGMAGMNGGHPRGGSMSEDMLYSVEGQKNTAGATSAFTPIQSTIPGLPAGTSPSSAAGGHRSASAYFPYGPDSFGFGSSPGKSGNGGSAGAMDMKMDGKSMGSGNGVGIPGSGGTTAFPNQLIALHQIRNYASMPGGNIPTSLASTEQQQQQQSNNNSSNNNNSSGQSSNGNKDK